MVRQYARPLFRKSFGCSMSFNASRICNIPYCFNNSQLPLICRPLLLALTVSLDCSRLCLAIDLLPSCDSYPERHDFSVSPAVVSLGERMRRGRNESIESASTSLDKGSWFWLAGQRPSTQLCMTSGSLKEVPLAETQVGGSNILGESSMNGALGENGIRAPWRRKY